MRMLTVFLISVLVFVHAVYGEGAGEGDFKLVKQDDVVSLYERWFVNAQGEQVRELKAIFMVRSNISEITSLLMDSQRGAKWNKNAKEYKIFSTGNTWVTYIRYGVPWPFDDHDCSLRCYIKNSNEKLTEINFESAAHEKYPVQKSVTRVTGVKGKWQMYVEGKEKVCITYLVSSNRDMKIPAVDIRRCNPEQSF